MSKIVIPPMTEEQLEVIAKWIEPEESKNGTLYFFNQNLDQMIDALLCEGDNISTLSMGDRLDIIRSFRLLQKQLLLFRSVE